MFHPTIQRLNLSLKEGREEAQTAIWNQELFQDHEEIYKWIAFPGVLWYLSYIVQTYLKGCEWPTYRNLDSDTSTNNQKKKKV